MDDRIVAICGFVLLFFVVQFLGNDKLCISIHLFLDPHVDQFESNSQFTTTDQIVHQIELDRFANTLLLRRKEIIENWTHAARARQIDFVTRCLEGKLSRKQFTGISACVHNVRLNLQDWMNFVKEFLFF
jgi:hypothetical protein